jgi:hypothetical protein
MAQLQLHLLMVFGTHVHTGAWLAAAVFLQVPALPPTVHALPPEHTVWPTLVMQVPVAKKPILCRSPGNPLSWEQVPA